MSDALKLEAFKQNSDVYLITLLAIDYGGESSIYVCDAPEAVTSDGVVHDPWPFRFAREPQTDEEPEARLVIDNTDRRITEAIQAAETIEVAVVIVSSLDLDTPEYGPEYFELQNVAITVDRIQGTLVVDSPMLDGFPGHFYTPRRYPGMF